MDVEIEAGDLLLGRRTPHDEDHPIGFGVDHVDHRIGEMLPAPAPMGVCLTGSNGQDGVDEKNPLTGPRYERTGRGLREAEIR